MVDKKSKNNVVIDTNLLLDDAKILHKLSKVYKKIIIPITVLKELDFLKFKSETAFSARSAIRAIKEFKTEYSDKIHFDLSEIDVDLDNSNDAKIIRSAKNNNAALATKDISMGIIAGAQNLDTVLYDVVLNNLFRPYIYVEQDALFRAFNEGTFGYARAFYNGDYDDFFRIIKELSGRSLLNKETWFFVIINTPMERTVVYAHNPTKQVFQKIDDDPKYCTIKNNKKATHIKARDIYQKCAIYALKEAQHVLITGKYGSGKTLLATAQTLAKEDNKIFVTRAPIGLNSKYNIGFVPGPQPLSAKILTPNGWTTMGELVIGDKVVGKDGKATKILNIYDKGKKPVYKIKTSDGKETRACGDHLWATKTHNESKHNYEFKLRSTLDIKNNLLNDKTGPKYNITLPTNEPVVFEECGSELPIPPYTLGLLLAEGSLSDSINFTTADEEIAKRVEKELSPYNLYLTKHNIQYSISGDWESNKFPRKVSVTNTETGKVIFYKSRTECANTLGKNKKTISARCDRKAIIDGNLYEFVDTERRYANYIKHCLDKLGLLHKKCDSKFIPAVYKYTSIDNRVALIQGMMDGDGTIKKNKWAEQTYFTTSKKLVDDIIEVLRSLGVTPTYRIRDRREEEPGLIDGRKVINKLISYDVNVPKSEKYKFFSLTRKRDHITKPFKKSTVKVVSVEECGSEDVRCIKIDNKNSLYLTDDFIVTHNTKEEKMQDWLAGFMSALYYLYANTRGQSIESGYDYVKEVLYREKLEPIALNSIQGLSLLDNDTLVVDEVQLLDVSYMSMILSRPSEAGRLVMLGDLAQTYDVVKPSESGLLKLLRVLPHRSVAYVDLKASYRSDVVELADLLQDKTMG